MARLGGVLLDVGRLRRHRDFRLVMTGQLIGGMGRQVTLIALPYQLYVLTRSPLAIGALALVQLVPLLAFSLAGGAIADTVDRRRLLLVTQSGLLACSVALAIRRYAPSRVLHPAAVPVEGRSLILLRRV